MPSPRQKKWTVIAYLVADHGDGTDPDSTRDLDAVAAAEVANLTAAVNLDQCHLVAQVDFSGSPGVRRYLSGDGRIRERRLAEQDSALISPMNRLIELARDQCPAERYLLMLWGHGAGPVGMFFDEQRGVTTGGARRAETLSLRELRRMLGHARSQWGLGHAIDIVLVKSCCMAMVEAAWELRGVCRRLISSQARVPLKAWSYTPLFEALEQNADLDTTGHLLTQALAREFADPAARRDREEIPFSLVDPTGIRHLVDPVSALARALRAVGVGSAAVQGAIQGARVMPDVGGDPALLDFVALCEGLQQVAPLRETAARVLRVFSSRGQTPVIGREPEQSRYGGLGVYQLPPALLRADSFANDVNSDDYRKLRFHTATGWGDIALFDAPTATH